MQTSKAVLEFQAKFILKTDDHDIFSNTSSYMPLKKVLHHHILPQL